MCVPYFLTGRAFVDVFVANIWKIGVCRIGGVKKPQGDYGYGKRDYDILQLGTIHVFIHILRLSHYAIV